MASPNSCQFLHIHKCESLKIILLFVLTRSLPFVITYHISNNTRKILEFQTSTVTHQHINTLNTNISSVILANYQESNIEYPLPHPVSRIIFQYATLTDPLHIIPIVRFLSIIVVNDHGQPIFYVQRLTATALPQRHGWNPIHGRDPGPPPPSIPPTQPPPPYVTHPQQDPNAMSGRGYNTFHGFDTGPPPPGFAPTQPAGVAQFPTFSWPQPAFGWPAQPTFTPQSIVAPPPLVLQPQFPGFGFPIPGSSYPAIATTTDLGFPGIHLRNHTGGVGLPPGYNYAFPQEHTKIHVFTTKEKPWQVTAPLYNWDASNHVKMLVPCTTTVKELMQNLGCTNEDAKKNILHEITEAGNGKWVKGLTITGDDKDRVKKTISEFGWDKSRTGNPGERPVVWLYVTKD